MEGRVRIRNLEMIGGVKSWRRVGGVVWGLRRGLKCRVMRLRVGL
jgi:hypothetical protein